MSTRLVYRSWLKTEKPILYKTNDAKGKELIVDCQFKDPLTHKEITTVQHDCTICAKRSEYGIPNKKFFSSNYTDWSMHKNPIGTHVCEACAFTMLLNTESNRMTLSRYSFYADAAGLVVANRVSFRDVLINPPAPPFVMVCAVSQKKHLAIKSKVSYSRKKFYCMFEEECVVVDLETMQEIMLSVEALRGIGFTKDEIEKNLISFDKVKKFESTAIEKIKEVMGRISKTRMFPLALHNAQKSEEEEALCYLDLTLKTANEQPQHCSSTASTKVEMSNEDQVDMKCGGKSSDWSAPAQSEQLTLLGL